MLPGLSSRALNTSDRTRTLLSFAKLAKKSGWTTSLHGISVKIQKLNKCQHIKRM
jgi:hypothetical protein